MTRIAKADVHAVLDRVAKNITDAAAPDGVTSRKDLESKLKSLTGTEKVLTDRFFRFIDHRDQKPGARITAADVTRAVDFAKEKLITAYDLNRNGLSASEVAKMSVTGQLAVKLAAETKGVDAPLPAPKSGALAQAVAAAARNTYFVSEGDSQPTFVEGKLPAQIDGASVYATFKDALAASFDVHDGNLSAFTFEVESKTFIADTAKEYSDPTLDSYYHKNAKGFARLQKVIDENLTDVTVIRVGPRDDKKPNELATDQGAYQYLVVGKSKDGKLAGIMFESVET